MSILSVCAKCSDLCSCIFTDSEGEQYQSDSYVPKNIGIGSDDYVELEIETTTGQILNWKSVTDKQVIKALKKA